MSNRYRLIKEYPGSPKLGTILTHEELQWCNWDEYYQEVVEKEYEILSLKRVKSRSIYRNILTDKPNIDSWLRSYAKDYWIINSVKRLSDGKEEIFTIGDKTNNGTISKFEIDSNRIRVFFEEKPKNYHVSLNTIKHAKTALFRTEDGVDIFENNTSIYHVDKSLNIKFIKHKDFKVISKNVKYFSTKEKAEEYILYNKPVLSLKEIKETTTIKGLSLKKLEKLVQQKLNK